MAVDAGAVRAAYGGGRVSAQRAVIAQAAMEFGAAFSAEELYAKVAEKLPGVGLATVYRSVAAMEAAGFVEGVGMRAGATLYVQCSHAGHHHHVVCTGCGAVADAECSVNASAASASGFAITGHDLTLYGLCPRCQR